MEKISATWTKLATSDHLQRSSHVVSVVDGDAYISGGELLPRQPRDNHVYKLNLKAKSKSTYQTCYIKCLEAYVTNHLSS